MEQLQIHAQRPSQGRPQRHPAGQKKKKRKKKRKEKKRKLAGHDSEVGLGVHQVGAAKVVRTALREDMSTRLEPHRLINLHTSVLGQQLRVQAAPSAQHSPTCVDQLGLTVCGEGGRASSQTGSVPTVVTRVLTSEVARGGGIREWAQPLVALRAIPRSGCEHGHRGRSVLGSVGAGHTFLGEWVGDVRGPALYGTLSRGVHRSIGAALNRFTV